MLVSGAELDPLVAEAGRDAVLDRYRLNYVVDGLVAHPVQEVAARPHLLQGGEVATFVVHASQAVADELLRDEAERVAVALPGLVRGIARPLADLEEYVAGAVGHPPIKFTPLLVGDHWVPEAESGVFFIPPASSNALLL